MTDPVHPVVPVPAAHERQAVHAELQAVEDGPRAVLVQGPGLVGAARQVVVALLAVVERPARQVGDLLVEHAGVAREGHVPRDGVRQPQVVVRASRADAAPAGRVPPMLHVPLDELPLGAAQEMLPGTGRAPRAAGPRSPGADRGSRRPRPTGRSRCGPTCGTRAPGTAASRSSARSGRHPASRRRARPACHSRTARPPPARRARPPRRGGSGSSAMASAVLLARAEDEDDLPLCPRGQLHPHLHRGARVQARTQPPGEAPQAQRRRARWVAVASQELGAVAADAAHGLAAVEEGHGVGELAVVAVAGENRARQRLELGHDVHGLPGPQVAEHQVDRGEDADGAAARARGS